jgi:hypothetical protein
MATQATANQRIDIRLSAIAAEIDSLPSIEADWSSMPDDHQAAFLLEWDESMARLEGLDREFRANQMTPAQQFHYSALLRKLGEVTPAIKRLGLPGPRIALEA